MAREELNMKRKGADPAETLYPLLSFLVPQLGDRGVSSAADRCDFLPLLISDLSACMDLLSIYLDLASPLFFVAIPTPFVSFSRHYRSCDAILSI